MERCTAAVRKSGKSEQVAIAICYSSIAGKKVLLSPVEVADVPVGDLRQGEQQLTWDTVPDDEWGQRQQARRKERWQPQCSVVGCGAAATQLVSVKGQKLPYCGVHLAGAKEVLARHKLAVEAVEELEIIEIDMKGNFITTEGRVVFVGGPGSGGGGSGKATDMSTALSGVPATHLEGVLVTIADDFTPENASMRGSYVPPSLGKGAEILVTPGGDADTLLHELGHHVTGYNADTKMPSLVEMNSRPGGVDQTYLNNLIAADKKLTGDDFWKYGLSEYEKSTPAEARCGLYKIWAKARGGDKDAQWNVGNVRADLPFYAQYMDGVFQEKKELDAASILSDSTKDLDTVAAAIADRANNKAVDAALVKSAFLEPWLQTVFGTPESNQLQKVTARTFGFPDPPGTEELDINWKLLYPMGEMYNITQDYLKERGFSEFQTVPVYRPYLPSEARPKQWQKDDEVRIRLLPLTSWTLNKADAVKVSQFLGSAGSPAFVLKTFIPIKSVVSTPNTGIGMPGTSEVVLAGGEYEAVVDERYE